MKVAVITGAAQGIGLALCHMYLKKGVRVVMVDKDQTKLKKESQHLAQLFSNLVIPIACDITEEAEVHKLIAQVKEQCQQVDWIYNNAGIIGGLQPIWESPMPSIRHVMEVNLFGMIHIIQAFMPLLCAQTFPSRIINMASLYALCSGSQTGAYAMSKHAVLALSESLYFDLNRLKKPVQVSVVFPSFTDTGLMANASSTGSFQETLKSLLSRSRSALDVAEHIALAVDRNEFYIFPDKEVKTYCEERTEAIVSQKNPHVSAVEKLLTALLQSIEK